MFRGEQEWVGTAYPGMSRVGGRALSLQSSPGGRPSWPGQPCSCPLCSPLTGGAPAPHCGPAPARRDLGSSAPCHVERSTCLSRREAWQRGIVVWASRKSDSWEDYLETSISKKKKKKKFHSNHKRRLFGWLFINSSNWTHWDSVQALSLLTTARNLDL